MNPPSYKTSADIPSPPVKKRQAYTVIRPVSGWVGVNLPQLWQYRELCLTFAVRDIKLRYRQTVLGAIWVLIQPLMAAGVFSFVFNKVAQLSTEGIPAFLFTFVGMLGWNVFNTTLNKSANSVLSHSGLVSKIFFPRLLLPLSAVLTTLVDFSIAFGALLCLLFAYGKQPSIYILLLPIWIFFLLLLALGLGIVASALMVSYRDIGYILPVTTSLLLYLSPIAYSLPGVLHLVDPRWHFVFYLNPLVGLLEAMRWSVFGTTTVHWNLISYSIIFGIALITIAMFCFRRLERQFADVI